MKLQTICLCVIATAVLVGCQKVPHPIETSPKNLIIGSHPINVAAAHQVDPSDYPTLDGTLRKGMAYGNLRDLVMKSGWTPVPDPSCSSNVIGENYSAMCKTATNLDVCHACDDLPELSACSGDGYCGMQFRSGDVVLNVTTYGMIEDRKVIGETSRLEVMGWQFERSKRP